MTSILVWHTSAKLTSNLVCDERTDEIKRYADNGNQKGSEHLMVDALRSYYWGMLLCVAHPQGKSVKIVMDNESVFAHGY